MPVYTIKYDNKSRGMFYSGQTLSGTIQFQNEKKRSITCIFIELKGYAKCFWKEFNRAGLVSGSFEGKEKLIEKCEFFMGSRSNQVLDEDKMDRNLKELDKINLKSDFYGVTFSHQQVSSSSSSSINSDQFDLSKGLYEYKFNFELPAELPTSIEAEHGHVRYMITFKVCRKWKQDYEYDFPVTIIRNLDLNSNPSLKVPFKIEDKKHFETSSMFVAMSVETLVTGYVSGQRAKFLINVNNQSGVYINHVQVGLFQIIHYNSQNPKKKKIWLNLIKSYENTGILQFTSKEIMSYVNIPALDPSTENFFKILEIFYEVHVKAKIVGLESSPMLKIPIVIGTKPFAEIQESNVPQPSTSRANLPSMAPPSYNEVMNDTGSSNNHVLNLIQEDSSPRYSLYDKNSKS